MRAFLRHLLFGLKVSDLTPALVEVHGPDRNAERHALYLIRQGQNLRAESDKGVALAERGYRIRRGERLRARLAMHWARQWPHAPLLCVQRMRMAQQAKGNSNVHPLRAGGQ